MTGRVARQLPPEGGRALFICKGNAVAGRSWAHSARRGHVDGLLNVPRGGRWRDRPGTSLRTNRWTVSRGSVVVVGQGSVLFLPVTLQLAVPRSRHVSCVCLDLVVLFVAVFSCGFVVVVCFGTWPWTWQLVFLLPQINADGQWIFWRVLDNDLRGAATALQYLKTPNGRYILLGVGSEVRRVFAPPLTL